MISGWLTDKEDFWKKICKKPLAAIPMLWFCLSLSWRRPLSYRNQSIDLWTGFYMITALIKPKLCVSTFFCNIQVDTVYQRVLYNSLFFLLLRHIISKTKEHILHKRGFILLSCFTQKKKFSAMNEIKLVWFYSLYRNSFSS